MINNWVTHRFLGFENLPYDRERIREHAYGSDTTGMTETADPDFIRYSRTRQDQELLLLRYDKILPDEVRLQSSSGLITRRIQWFDQAKTANRVRFKTISPLQLPLIRKLLGGTRKA